VATVNEVQVEAPTPHNYGTAPETLKYPVEGVIVTGFPIAEVPDPAERQTDPDK